MKCFNLRDREAIGICKSCNKGICEECSVDLGHGIACLAHTDEVNALNQILTRSKDMVKQTKMLIIEMLIYTVPLDWYL